MNQTTKSRILNQILTNTLTGSSGIRLSPIGAFEYRTNEGRIYPTSNPYYVPGTGNKAGTGSGGGGGPSNVIPDPSGRTDRHGNPIYIVP